MIVDLMHCNHVVAIMEISDSSGAILRCAQKEPERMPYLKEMNLTELNHWWKYRAVPENRHGTSVTRLKQIDNPLLYQAKNLALSLSDCYWVRPISIDLSWDDVNLYENIKYTTFKTEDNVTFSNDPNCSLNGSRPKEALFQNGYWELLKYRESTYGEQCINEAFASMVHELQDFGHFMSYDVQMKKDIPVSCTCRFFTDKNTEFVPAWNFTAGAKHTNEQSPYESYIEQCSFYGLNEDDVRKELDYQTLTDFVISNNDRHYNNFGVVRDPESLKVISLAPIFDFGNSMFHKNCYNMSAYEILSLEITAMAKREEKMLEYVKNKDVVNIDLLPSAADVKEFYETYSLPEKMADAIAGNYQKKIDMLYMFQNGHKISRYVVKDWDGFMAEKNKTENCHEQEKIETSMGNDGKDDLNGSDFESEEEERDDL